jgi:hypothetical protein
LVAGIGSYSSIQGLLIWPVGLVLLYHRRRPMWAFVSWVGVGLVTTALYFYNYHAKSVSPTFALRHPVTSGKLFLFALGDIVGVQTPAPHGTNLQLLFGESTRAVVTPGNVAVLLFGAVILVLAVFIIVNWGLRRDPDSAAPIGIALIAYGLLFGVLITDGRVLFGYWGVSQSRYTTYDVLVVVGIYLTALSHSPALERTGRRAVMGIALAIMAVQVVFSAHYGIAGARSQERAGLSAVALIRNIDHESDLTVYGLDLGESPQEIRQDVAFLREHHLSLFGSPSDPGR